MKTADKWRDPFDEMSDDEFDAHVDRLFSARPATVAVSLRMPPDLLGRMKRQAARAGVPYQTFMKSILEVAVSRLEQRREARRPVARVSRGKQRLSSPSARATRRGSAGRAGPS